MRKLVECVPNISEGCNKAVIDEIVSSARIEGVEVLDVDPGKATNRTVITFVGEPEPILEAAFQLIKRAGELIDMRQHKGAHPRQGATDVCPFVPLQNVSMEECAELARRLGRRVADELAIPVYLYEAAASSSERQSLAYLRQGEYEGLAEKFKNPKLQPDFGKPVVNEKAGATVIGARPFLIAYNINLNTRDKRLASRIAMRLRESGCKKKGPDGKVMLDSTGNPLMEAGMFQCCRAVGWFIEEYGIAQISINFTNFEVTPPHLVFDAASKLATDMGLRVTGSELVGLIPKKALLMAGEYYLRKQGSCRGVPEATLLEIAVKSLGLAELASFDLSQKVVEERVKVTARLGSLRVSDFIDVLSSDSPAPGGGSASALAGAMAAGLISMVSALTFGKTDASQSEKMAAFDALAVECQNLKASLLFSVDEDTEAFNHVMNAARLKAASPAEEKEKGLALIAAYRYAVTVPLRVATDCLRTLELCGKALTDGLPTAFSDAAVASQQAAAGCFGAIYNVRINLPELESNQFLETGDRKFIEETKVSLQKILSSLSQLRAEHDALIMVR